MIHEFKAFSIAGILTLTGLVWVTSCASPPAEGVLSTPTVGQVIPSSSPLISQTASPMLGSFGTPTLPDPTTTYTPGTGLCPPLAGYSLEELTTAISNPFNPPARPGSDDPHQAVDLAVTQNGIALAGAPVHAVMSGLVAAVIADRFPYGNALMVETPLGDTPPGWLVGLQLPTPAPTLPPHPSLTCPHIDPPPVWNLEARSLYLLYAHMQEPVTYQLGDPVECGARIGRIGQSGNALNPHVHLEARFGPAGARFASLAHYESRAAPEEMSNYCVWRVSGIFQLADPMLILALIL